jgi:hypothetical protein
LQNQAEHGILRFPNLKKRLFVLGITTYKKKIGKERGLITGIQRYWKNN